MTIFYDKFQPLTIAAVDVPLFTALAQQILLEKQQKAPYKSEIIRSHRHRVAGYAAELGITPNYLNEIVKEQTARNAGANVSFSNRVINGR